MLILSHPLWAQNTYTNGYELIAEISPHSDNYETTIPHVEGYTMIRFSSPINWVGGNCNPG